jgi:hypothetical protein
MLAAGDDDGSAASDPLRMFLVARRGGLATIARGGELAGAAAVRCTRAFAHDERFASDLGSWHARPGKVMLRARGGQWLQLLREEPHVLAGTADGEGVVALPPRRRSTRGPPTSSTSARGRSRRWT